MPWSAHISSEDVVAIHAALLPTDNGDGQIVLFGGDDHYHGKAPHINTNFDHTKSFNCRTPTTPLTYVRSVTWDVFCCGHSMLGDGRLLIAGGTNTFPPESAEPHLHLGHFTGHHHCAVYDPSSNTLTPVADMGPEPGVMGKGGGRWYPTLCTLSSGEVLALEGHPDNDDDRHGNNTPERYQPYVNTWVTLPELSVLTEQPVVYPRAHLLNDGNVFISSRIPLFSKNVKVDPATGAVNQVVDLPHPAYHGFDYPSVLLPLVPSDRYTPRVLLCGQTPPEMLNFSNLVAGWQAIPRDAAMEGVFRVHSCATILPTGHVLLTGGADRTDDQNSTGNRPELYHTPLDAATKAYTAGVGRWETLEDPATLPRNYHSTALLMPDGNVWTAGGNAPGQPYDREANPAIQKQIEIFQPPYPAGPRPVITSCPSYATYGQHFPVAVLPNADSVENVILMRCGSSTHAFNPDQRSVWLEFSRTGDTLDVVAPPDGGVAPPAYYMVFVVDAVGRPCEYAKFVHLGPA